MTNSYARACNEVLILLKTYLTKEEYEKISKDRIEFYEKNKDISYGYEIDSNLPLEKQKISKKANAMIVAIFRDFFATQNQKEKLKNVLEQNDRRMEQQKLKQYNSKDLFKNKQTNIRNNENSVVVNEVALVEYKEQNVFKKLLNRILRVFRKK